MLVIELKPTPFPCRSRFPVIVPGKVTAALVDRRQAIKGFEFKSLLDSQAYQDASAALVDEVPQTIADELDKLRPHLARAALLSGRLGLDRAKTTVATLEMIGLPAAALTNTGRAISANASFLAGSPRIRVGANDAVKFQSEPAQLLLMEAVSNISNWRTGVGKSIPIAGTRDEPPMVAHVVPLRGALDLFTGALSIVFFTSMVPKSSPAPELLQALFDLTPAEARLASQLTQGKSIEQIGLSTDLSPNTLRTQLKSVFSKTGVRRQTELVSLLGMRTV